MKSTLTLNTNIKPIYARSIEEFNDYVNRYKTPYTIKLTKSGNISQSNLRNMPCSLTWKRGNHMEFHYLSGKLKLRVIYAIHYDANANTDKEIAIDALNYFKDCLDLIPTDDKEEDINLFTCPENPLSAYYNYVNERYLNFTINNCFSLDRNNSFPASMAEVYPETRDIINKYYAERLAKKGQPDYERFKLFGSIFVGWLKDPRYHRTHAWKRIIDNSNHKVHQLRKYIESCGNTVLLVNTDAVKFIGKVDYTDNYDLGGFKYEWQNAKMYIKGVKSYAYNEADKWKFKQAGKCKLDYIKPREDWTLEDFKKADTLQVVHILINRENGELYEKVY